MFAMVMVLTEIEEEAAQAYDVATMKYRGTNAVANFDIKNYDVDKIQSAESSRLTRKPLKIRKNSTTHPRLVPGSSSNTVNPQINASSSNNNLSVFVDQTRSQDQQTALVKCIPCFKLTY